MKHLVVNEILLQDVDLHGVAIDQVNTMLSNSEGFHNIRFELADTDYRSYDIVGSRFETDAEARKRIDAAKKVKQKQQEEKQKEIKYLEKQLAKLKASK